MMPVKKWRDVFTAPEDDQPVTIETQAVDAMRLATDNAALEHAVADMTVRLRHVEHENDELRVNNELLTEENEQLRRDLDDVNERALPDSISVYLRMVEQDKIDRPPADGWTGFCHGCGKELDTVQRPDPLCADCDPNGRPDLVEWVDVVEPSKNGTQ